MFKIHSLYAKLAISLSLILLIIGLSYVVLSSFLMQQLNTSTQQQLNQGLAKKLVADQKIVLDGKIDIKAMQHTFMEYMSINPIIEIYYLDLQGKILAYSAEPGKVKRKSIDISPIKKVLNNKDVVTLGEDPRAYNRLKPFSVTQIPNSKNPQGYLYVVLLGEEYSAAYEQHNQNAMWSLAGSVLGGSLLLGLLAGLFIFKRLTLRLRLLQKNVSDYTNSQFQSPEKLSDKNISHSQDEISQLQQHIATMGLRISEQWSALKQQDKIRREMVANISHDLRTPLASIQGYLETLSIKGDSLSAELRDKYIGIATRQTQHLQKLIDNLFELAKLDAKEHHPELEAFPIMELIYDVVNKLSIKADEKNIRLNIQTDIQNPQVIADIGLIERVLENLLNNAIYYTQEAGEINISLSVHDNNNIKINVSDNGEGIETQHQALIFERFHQAHTPDRSNGHAGLGLAIVKKIIDLHKQNIWLSSQPGEGASFNFTLAIAD